MPCIISRYRQGENPDYPPGMQEQYSCCHALGPIIGTLCLFAPDVTLGPLLGKLTWCRAGGGKASNKPNRRVTWSQILRFRLKWPPNKAHQENTNLAMEVEKTKHYKSLEQHGTGNREVINRKTLFFCESYFGLSTRTPLTGCFAIPRQPPVPVEEILPCRCFLSHPKVFPNV